MLERMIDSIALLAVGGLWGGMAFFAAVYAPLVFIKLEAGVAGQFIRQVFPVYYLAMGVTSAVAAAALALGSTHGATDIVAIASFPWPVNVVVSGVTYWRCSSAHISHQSALLINHPHSSSLTRLQVEQNVVELDPSKVTTHHHRSHQMIDQPACAQ